MKHTVSRLTVFFDAPFWVGVYERMQDGQLEAARVVFGAEPKDYEVYDFFLTHWGHLPFSPPVVQTMDEITHENPKRRQRKIQKQLTEHSGVGTKAQQALKAQQEAQQIERKVKRHERRLQEKEHQFALRQEKKKQKHRGR